MIRVASISDCDEERSFSGCAPSSIIAAQVYASFTMRETRLLASLTVFPSDFDIRAGAAVADVTEDQFSDALEGLATREVISVTLSTEPRLFRLAKGARDLLIRLPTAQEAIYTAHQRHDDYFLARLTGSREEAPVALEKALYREFIRVNLELAARRRIHRLIGLPEGVAGRPEGLTQRQWEVAQLVAAGRTNYQIAQAMRISEWTVVNHLRAVMRRMGCFSRVDVARIVLS